MLHSWEAGESKRRGDLKTGLPGVAAVSCGFLRCPYVPPLGLLFPHLLQELRPPLRVSAQALCWCLWERMCSAPGSTGGAAAFANLAILILLLLQPPLTIAKPFSLETWRISRLQFLRWGVQSNHLLEQKPVRLCPSSNTHRTVHFCTHIFKLPQAQPLRRQAPSMSLHL